MDTSFNFTTDTPSGLDPDRWSRSLHRYHQLLWGGALPNGRRFDLVTRVPSLGACNIVHPATVTSGSQATP